MKPVINKEILTQYIYDYGFDKACNILKIDSKKANDLLDPKPSDNVYYERKLPKKRSSLNATISQVIAENYNELYAEFVKDVDTCTISQSDDDIFHNTLSALLEDSGEFEGKVINYIKQKLNAAYQRHAADYKSYKKHNSNSDDLIFNLEIEDDAND